jgi:hypothetical protein
MSTSLTFVTSGSPCRTRFVLVNGRVPRTDQQCALCGAIVDKGYVRDSQTRIIYCDTQCFAGGVRIATPAIKNQQRRVS